MGGSFAFQDGQTSPAEGVSRRQPYTISPTSHHCGTGEYPLILPSRLRHARTSSLWINLWGSY